MRVFELLLWLDAKPQYFPTKAQAKEVGMDRTSNLRPTVYVTELEIPTSKADFMTVLNGGLPSAVSRKQSWQMTARGGLTSLSKPIEPASEA